MTRRATAALLASVCLALVIACPAWAGRKLYVKNADTKTINVAVAIMEWDFDDESWTIYGHGWTPVEPGETTQVAASDAENFKGIAFMAAGVCEGEFILGEAEKGDYLFPAQKASYNGRLLIKHVRGWENLVLNLQNRETVFELNNDPKTDKLVKGYFLKPVDQEQITIQATRNGFSR